MDRVPFTFAVALAPRSAVRSWARVEALLGLTLKAAAAQTDPHWRVLLLGHDRPSVLADDRRVEFRRADWAAEPTGPENRDAGRKKAMLTEMALADGGGLFMFLDADDWVGRTLVETARRTIRGEVAGGFVARGWAVDPIRERRAALPGVTPAQFHQLCGSSTVARLRPDADDPVRRDPMTALGSHHLWPETAADLGLTVAPLDATAAYLVGTSENHSETLGWNAGWRRSLTDRVAQEGEVTDDAWLSRFGLRRTDLAPLHARSLPSALQTRAV